MPTGYTAGVQDGELQTAKDYLMTCAGGTWRFDTPIPDKIPLDTSYYDDKIAKTEQELLIMLKDPISLYTQAKKEHDEYQRASLESQKLTQQRYENMLQQVQEWEPPTEDHQELKKFALNQLEQALKFDCYKEEIEPFSEYEEWLEKHNIQLLRDMVYCYDQKQQEIDRVNKRQKWLDNLRNSLENLK